MIKDKYWINANHLDGLIANILKDVDGQEWKVGIQTEHSEMPPSPNYITGQALVIKLTYAPHKAPAEAHSVEYKILSVERGDLTPGYSGAA